MRNLGLALRTLARTPFVTTIAALSLGLGIGANAAIYSIFHTMLRQDLPVREPDRLVNLAAPGPKNGSQSCSNAGSCDVVFSYPMFRDLQQSEQKVFTAIAAHRETSANLGFENRAFNENGLLVSGTYFPVLGVRPALGRLLTPADDETEGGHPVVVLAHQFWANQLGGDSSVIGKSFTVAGQPLTIVGVVQEGFKGTTVDSRPAFFAPLAMAGPLRDGMDTDERRAYWLYLFARLAPGVSMDQAHTAINAIYRPIINEVEVPLQTNMADSILVKFRQKEIALSPGNRGQSQTHEAAQGPLAMLFAVTGFVLLIACANIANLLLARATGREMEMAVRLSLGATRRQLMAQLLTESVTLALLGGLSSILFASLTLRGITALVPSQVTDAMQFTVSMPAVAFAGALSVATGLAFGLFPALHSTRPDLVTALRNNSGKLAGGRAARRFRTTLATGQIALAMALLMSAGLFLKSLWKVGQVELGVQVERLVTFTVSPSGSGYDSVRARTLFDRLEEDLGGVPGVNAVTSAMVPLISGSSWSTSVAVEGFDPPPNTRTSSHLNAVGPGFFRTVGMELLAGREFDDADVTGRPKVAIVNETFARRFNLGRNPVGKRMRTGSSDTLPLDMEIIGLARDARYARVGDTVPPVFFTPHRQRTNLYSLNFYLRTNGDPSTLVRAIPGVVARLDPMMPVQNLKTMPQEIRENTAMYRMISTVSASFASLATVLAAIGLYGVLAYSVAQRTREIGVRMALGARAGQVRTLVMRQVGFMVLIGGVLGVAAAIGVGKISASVLYGVTGSDPWVMASSVVFLAMVALAAGYVPARRASRVDPMQALRYE